MLGEACLSSFGQTWPSIVVVSVWTLVRLVQFGARASERVEFRLLFLRRNGGSR